MNFDWFLRCVWKSRRYQRHLKAQAMAGTLRNRIDRLDRRNRPSNEAPRQIVLYGICHETGERLTAAIMGGIGFTRERDETEPDFMARVTAGAAQSVLLPDNGR